MMKAKEHRKREREHQASVRYNLKHRNYVGAFQALAWAFQQSTAGDIKEALERDALATVNRIAAKYQGEK